MAARYKDEMRHKRWRADLIEQLRTKSNIKDEAVLSAMSNIPRHIFLDNAFENHAYQDRAFQIGDSQTISQPTTVALQTQMLEVKKGHKILEVGTGSGYQACVLAELGARVYSIERIKRLHERALETFETLGYHNITCCYGDGYKGWPHFAPFDSIIVTAAAREIPEELVKQLKVGGVMVIPVGPEGRQKMLYIVKVSQTESVVQEKGNFRFVPMLPGLTEKYKDGIEGRAKL